MSCAHHAETAKLTAERDAAREHAVQTRLREITTEGKLNAERFKVAKLGVQVVNLVEALNKAGGIIIDLANADHNYDDNTAWIEAVIKENGNLL